MGKSGSEADILVNMTFYYSVDGENYTKINEEVETDVSMEYLFKFDTVQARYIKVESDRPEGRTNWIVIREFKAGMDLEYDPTISFSIEGGAEVAPGAPITYTVSADNLEVSAQFEKDEAYYGAYEGFAPNEAGTYAFVVTVAATEKTNAVKKWVVFTVVAPAAE